MPSPQFSFFLTPPDIRKNLENIRGRRIIFREYQRDYGTSPVSELEFCECPSDFKHPRQKRYRLCRERFYTQSHTLNRSFLPVGALCQSRSGCRLCVFASLRVTEHSPGSRSRLFTGHFAFLRHLNHLLSESCKFNFQVARTSSESVQAPWRLNMAIFSSISADHLIYALFE